MPYRKEPEKLDENRIPQMSKGSRRLMGLDTKQQSKQGSNISLYKNTNTTLNNSRSNNDPNLSSTNKLSTSDDDDEEYVLMYDAK